MSLPAICPWCTTRLDLGRLHEYWCPGRASTEKTPAPPTRPTGPASPGAVSAKREPETSQEVLENVASRLKPVRRNRYQCPSCGDWKQGIDVRMGRNGKVLVYCYACCPVGGKDAQRDILAAIGLTFEDLSVPLKITLGFAPSGLTAPGVESK